VQLRSIEFDIYLRRILAAVLQVDPIVPVVIRVRREDRSRCQNCRPRRSCRIPAPKDPPATLLLRSRVVAVPPDSRRFPAKAKEFRLIASVQPRRVGKSAACPSLFARQLGISSTYFQNGDATTDDNIVTDILHDASRFTGDEGQQDGCLV